MAERNPSDDQAAFGVFPQLKRNRSKQDREAAKNVPVDLARGALAGVLGAPGDIESLVRMLPYLDEKTVLPTSEDIEKRLPLRSETPVSKAATGLGILGGGFYTGPGSPLRVAGALPGALKHGAEEFAKASVAGVPHVVKPKGGNWYGKGVEDATSRLKPYDAPSAEDKAWVAEQKAMREAEPESDARTRALRAINEDIALHARNEALNKWVDSNLTNYVKKEMATPEDPVRKLAEQGITHFPIAEDPSYWARRGEASRKNLGGNEMAQSDLAKQWENRTDAMMKRETAQQHQDFMHLAPGMYSKEDEWLKKLAPETNLYDVGLNPRDLGFDHILDVLRQDVAAGRIRPDQLNKVSMEQAVRRVHEYDQEMARKMAETQLKATEGMPVHKEYPEGYKWIELGPSKELPEGWTSKPTASGGVAYFDPQGIRHVHPNADAVAEALKYEGNTMGHCVGGYCPDVLEGRSRIFSLRDAKGEPHVTIETSPHNPNLEFAYAKKNLPELHEKYSANRNQYENSWPEFLRKEAPELLNATGEEIVQIKGKGNAKPKEDYLPYVQDFVKGGKWSDVGDFHHTGLTERGSMFTPDELRGFADLGQDVPMYLSKEDIAKLRQARGDAPPAEGMKRGGVAISNNPDTMMLELGNQKMAGGGLTKLIKGAQTAAKAEVPIKFPVSRGPSIEEIRAMAERMAPQVMGEFVRAAPTPSNPKPSTSVVGKTQKQFEREKTLPIEYENIKEPVTPQEFDYAKKKGALLIGAQGDVTPGNRMLVSIDQQPLSTPVHLQAGPEWELYNPSAWAATDQMAKTWMNRAGKAAEAYDADPYLHYHKMTPDANWYAMHHFNSVLGHLRPEELKLRDPKLYQQMIEEIRTKDVGFGKHPEFEGFDDPLNLQIHAQIDPNFRRHIGAIFGGPKFTERYGLNSGQDVLAATSLPELRDLEAGASGYAVVPLDVKAPLKNFEAESQTYDTGFPKAGPSGRSKYPSPYQLIYRDTLNWMKDNPSANKSSEFGRMNMIVPKQQIDDELIDAIGEYQRRMKELTGKKKGGAVHKAQGGAITGDDLIVEERPL